MKPPESLSDLTACFAGHQAVWYQGDACPMCAEIDAGRKRERAIYDNSIAGLTKILTGAAAK
jgi:hypothetical protein